MLTLIQSHPASLGPHSGAGQAVGVTVINYNTAKQTLSCIASLGTCTEPSEIIEVQTGSYLDEDDIVRFEDTFGRAGS
jgi:GT2 family glycosyltransferase